MTIIRRFDAGDLKGYKVPGSRFRRIPKDSLADFASKHGMPVPDFRAHAGEDSTEGGDRARERLALVVEDDKRMAALMEKVLASDGWDVRIARNGFDAGFMAGSLLPRIVLLDIMLPGIDGREACKQMRKDPRLTDTRIMAVTALRDEKSKAEIFEAGVDAYLGKPFTISQLREEVTKLTNGKATVATAASEVKDSAGATD